MSASCPRYGFAARIVIHPDTGPRDVVRLRDSLLAAARERGLSVGLGGTLRHWRHLVWREGSQADHADQETVRGWGAAHVEVATVDVGPLVDLDEG